MILGNFISVLTLEAKTYYWRVYADITEYKEDKSDLTVRTFDVIDSSSIYVYCPGDATTCDDTQCSNDGGKTTTRCVGNMSKPFRTVQKAIVEAQRNDISVIKVASRDDNKAYTGIFSLAQGVSLLGGYTSDFTDANRDVATGKTILQGDSTYTVLASGVYLPTTFDGFIVKSASVSPLSVAFYIESSSTNFEIKNLDVVLSQVADGGAYGLFIEDKTFLNLDGITVTGSSDASDEAIAVAIGERSTVAISNSIITAGSAGLTADQGHSIAISISAEGTAVLSNNTISGGQSNNDSFGIYMENCSSVDVNGNTINGGAAANQSYGVYVKECSGTIRNNTISGGTVRAAGSTSYGLYSKDNDSGLTISSNSIQSGAATGESIGIGIWLSDGSKSGVVIVQNTIMNSSAADTYGIKIDTVMASNSFSVFNNIIIGSGSTNVGYGVYTNTNKLAFHNNTVVLTGAGTNNYGFHASLGMNALTIKNNIFSVVNAGTNCGVYYESSAASPETLYVNNSWIYAVTNQTCISDIESINSTNVDASSDPNLDLTTYYPTSSSSKNIRYGGVDLSADFTVDITGSTRSATLPGAPDTPDYGAGWSMGAYEY